MIAQLEAWKEVVCRELTEMTEGVDMFNAGHPENYYCDVVHIDPDELDAKERAKHDALLELQNAINEVIHACKQLEPTAEDEPTEITEQNYDPFRDEVTA